jgi:RNA polymerase sigma-70 factor (ECF subfamily)
MAADRPGDVTRLLMEWREGKQSALDELTPIVYDELRRLAAAYMRGERPDHTLQPTALLHEAYARLVHQRVPAFNNRAHFYGVAAQIMRQILVDFARARRAVKRGAGDRTPIDEAVHLAAAPSIDVLDLHDALDRLAVVDRRKARAIELRYFGGLTREEVAEAMAISLGSVKRDLALGEAWLRRDLTG